MGLPSAAKTANTTAPQTGDSLTYSISLIGSGLPVTVTDPIPPGTEYSPGSISGGLFNAALNRVEYTGETLEMGQAHSVVFGVQLLETRTVPIINTATVVFGTNDPLYPSAIIIANGQSTFLPLVLKRSEYGE
jgi:uncharacterized repeat protein (TIGR01451 family)